MIGLTALAESVNGLYKTEVIDYFKPEWDGVNGAFFRKCVTAVWVKDKVQHDHRIQS